MVKQLLLRLGLIFAALIIFYAAFLLIFPKHRPINASNKAGLEAKLDKNPESLFQYDPEISYRLKPNFVGGRHDAPKFIHETNSLGLLGKREPDRSPRASNIVFLGDSVGYGDYLDYPETLVARMQALAGADYALFNGSSPGWSTNQEIGYFRKYLSDVNWNMVVILFCVNDLVDFEWVFDHSNSFYTMAPEVKDLGYSGPVETSLQSVKIWNMRNEFRRDPRTVPLMYQNNTCLFAWDQQSWDRYAQKILKPFASTLGTRLLIVAVPSHAQARALAMGAPVNIALYPQGQLEGLAKEMGFKFVDGTQFLKGNVADLFLDDVHLTPKAHEQIAEGLWPVLEKILEGEGH